MTTRNDPALQNDINQLLYNVGRAITIWSDLEDRLFMCLTIAIDPNNINSLGAAFHSALTFKTKLDMCDTALKYHLKDNEELLSEWTRIFNRLSKHSKARSKIAHWPLIIIQYESHKEPVLQPSLTNFKATMTHINKEGDKLPRWNAGTVQEKTAIFSETKSRIMGFLE